MLPRQAIIFQARQSWESPLTLAVLASRALAGLQAQPVRVEVHLSAGLPAFHVVGLPDAEVRESRERVRAAIVNSGFAFPAGRITVNLAPADLPKESGRFDLPIALGILLAAGQVQVPDPAGDGATALSKMVFAGELSLTGALIAVAAPLAIALAVAREQPGAMLVMPGASAVQAARVPGLHVLAAGTLAEAAAHLAGTVPLAAVQAPPAAPALPVPCLSEVRGQEGGRRALELAAAGEHGLIMVGPPGAGKSMLAQRLPGLMPDMSVDEALEVAALQGLTGRDAAPCLSRPFRAPHHSASTAALVGGGSRPQPGEISLAHRGVLFLDELPEFERRTLEALREPLETGRIVIARALRKTEYPASFQLIAAMNPCPCGWHGHPVRVCSCRPDQVARYQARVSGPLLDRIDLQVVLSPPASNWLSLPPGEPTQVVAERVARSRERQQARQGCANAALPVAALDEVCALDACAQALLQRAMSRLGWSGRAAHRVLRIARTVADLAGESSLTVRHVGEAIQYRRGLEAGHANVAQAPKPYS